MNKLTHERRVRLVDCLNERCAIRANVRMTGIAKKTMMRFLVEVGVPGTSAAQRGLFPKEKNSTVDGAGYHLRHGGVKETMNPVVLQFAGSLIVAGVSAWFGSWLGVRNALRKLRKEKAFERRLTWFEDTVVALVVVRDLCVMYAVATRQRDAARLGQLSIQMGTAFQTLGEKANKVALYAPTGIVRRIGALMQELMALAMQFVQMLERGELYEEFAARIDSLVASLNPLIFDLAQEVRGELGIEKIELSDIEKKALRGREN